MQDQSESSAAPLKRSYIPEWMASNPFRIGLAGGIKAAASMATNPPVPSEPVVAKKVWRKKRKPKPPGTKVKPPAPVIMTRQEERIDSLPRLLVPDFPWSPPRIQGVYVDIEETKDVPQLVSRLLQGWISLLEASGLLKISERNVVNFIAKDHLEFRIFEGQLLVSHKSVWAYKVSRRFEGVV